MPHRARATLCIHASSTSSMRLVTWHLDSCGVGRGAVRAQPLLVRRTVLGESFGRGIERISRLPPWLRPTVIGAFALLWIMGWRILFAIPFLLYFAYRDGLAEGWQALAVLGLATAAGALGGTTFTLLRPILRHLGVVGAYLTGVGCVAVYLLFLTITLGPLTGEPSFDLRDRGTQFIWAFVTLVFGLLVGHFFREAFE